MARARNIKPGFFHNEQLVEVSFAARLLFIGLWTIADREGRLEDRPRRIKMQLFPADDLDVDAELNALHEIGVIVRYKHGDNRYIQVLNFTKHQHPHIKEAASTIPEPDESDTNPVQEKDKHETSPAESLLLNTDTGFPLTESRKSKRARAREEPDKPARTLSENKTKPAKRPDQAMWDAFVESLNIEPKAKGERGKWNEGIRQLRDVDVSPDDIPGLVKAYRKKYQGIDCNPKALANNLSAVMGSNGTRGSPAYRKRSVDPDEFRRKAAELEKRLAESQHEKDQ